MSSSPSPRLRFGVVTDVQYANAENGWDFHHTVERRYRPAAAALRRAMEHFGGDPQVHFVAQLGDLLDGKCKGAGTVETDWKDTIEPCFSENGFQANPSGSLSAQGVRDVVHCIGNHELYCFARDTELHEALQTRRGAFRGSERHFFNLRPEGSGFRFLVLDPYERSMLNGDAKESQDCVDWLRKHNPNDITAAVDWVAGLSGVARRWVPYNGSMTTDQIDWIKSELEAAAEAKERVIVLSHVSVCPGAQADETLLWNFEEVLDLLHKQPKGLVVACLYGHDHKGGFTQDAHGIYHKTFEAILETKSDAFAVIDCYDDRLEIRGHGDVKSQTWKFPSSDA